MSVQRPFQDSRVLVVGLGRFAGGVGVTQWLVAGGAQITVTDLASGDALGQSVAELAGLPVEFRLGGHAGIDPREFDLVVVNPAVRKDQSELFQSVVAAGTPWTTEMNLFCERCPAMVVGVTGSFGKSTTCAMLAHVLETQGARGRSPYAGVHLGGNIGRSLLSDLPTIGRNDVVVLEMSNAQLEDLPRIGWTPAVAVITNLFPHHLDRYASFDDYVAAKLNIVSMTDSRQPVVAGEAHPEATRRLKDRLRGDGDRLRGVRPCDVELSIPGRHNRANADCALAVCETLGLDGQVARMALKEFAGLPHRLEFVKRVGDVDYINDSKSTAPTATISAIEAILEWSRLDRTGRPLPAQPVELSCSGEAAAPAESPLGEGARLARTGTSPRIVAIVGGQAKGTAFEGCAARLAQSCRTVVCMGESGPQFASAIQKAAPTTGGREITIRIVEDLETAVQFARAEAHAADVVVFSPGCPSFDQYANFAERGLRFVELVNRL